MNRYNWNPELTKALYDLRNSAGLTWEQIAEKIDPKNLNGNDCRVKYQRTNWNLIIGKKPNKSRAAYWEDKNLIQLFTLKKAGTPYKEIASKLNTTIPAVHSMIKRHPDWENELETLIKKGGRKTAITQEVIDSAFIDNLVKGIIELGRHEIDRINELTKEEFLNRVILQNKTLPLSFTELKKRAMYELKQIGFSYPSSKVLGEGTYIICGDTHGKHTRSGMFDLIKNLSNHLKAKRVIHVGHFLDDDDTTNYNWNDFTNLTIIAKEEELKTIAKNKILHDIVRKEIILGTKLTVTNQDLIQDYVQSPISRSITPEYFESSTICNLHRHEFDTRCSDEGTFSVVASPGCLCENHIVYTVKQQDYTDGRTVKQTFPTGYKKYRRMQHLCKTWQQGVIIVHVDSKGDFSTVCCRVQKTSKGFATSYFDKIITEKEILDPEEKTIVNSDLHCDLHDPYVLDIEEQICKDYKPHVHINLGDLSGNTSINHHVFERIGGTRIKKSTLEEAATNYFILKRMTNWAKRRILLLGNHERFYEDFYLRFPQFEELLEFKFINGIIDEHIEVINMKQMKKIGNATYVHGDMFMFGQTGGHRLDKLFRTYGRNTIMGHCHYPSHRFDCYTIGLSGKLDLQYNETNASKWVHSIALVNTFENVSFITNVCIINNKTRINGKMYVPIKPDNWMVPEYKAKLSFEFFGVPKNVRPKLSY